MVDKLRHPAGQLVLFNPARLDDSSPPLRSVVLPYGNVQIDDPRKALDLFDTIGCLVRFGESSTACLAVGKEDELALQRIYVAGSFISTKLAPHTHREWVLKESPRKAVGKINDAHRLQLDLAVGDRRVSWVLPAQVRVNQRKREILKDGLAWTAYRTDSAGTPSGRPSFTSSWIVEGDCIPPDTDWATCKREVVFAAAIPRSTWAEDDTNKDTELPTPTQSEVVAARLRVYAPNDGENQVVLFDTDAASARLPFEKSELTSYLRPGESLTVRELRPGEAAKTVIDKLQVEHHQSGRTSQWGKKILDLLPVDSSGAQELDASLPPISVRGTIFEVIHTSNPRSVDSMLAESAARMVMFAMLMLAAVATAWLTIEVGIVRRVLKLTRRTSKVSRAARAEGDLGQFDFTDLRGGDELGILATGVDDLLKKISYDLQRTKLLMEQEKNMLQAIGHEIRSPVMSLTSLHPDESDPSRSYIKRMQKAIQALYGSASPSDGLESVEVRNDTLDLTEFLQKIAENAPDAGVTEVVFKGRAVPTVVRADAEALEDAITHILMNATRYRRSGTAITLGLSVDAGTAVVTIHNQGPHIPVDMIHRIFEYGVSDLTEHGASAHLGQGLFVTKTYLAKMGASVAARNMPDGVQFEIRISVVRKGR